MRARRFAMLQRFMRAGRFTLRPVFSFYSARNGRRGKATRKGKGRGERRRQRSPASPAADPQRAARFVPAKAFKAEGEAGIAAPARSTTAQPPAAAAERLAVAVGVWIKFARNREAFIPIARRITTHGKAPRLDPVDCAALADPPQVVRFHQVENMRCRGRSA